MIEYTHELGDVTPGDLAGFFEGWPRPPSPAEHLRILRRSDHVMLARDGTTVAGFATAISDGVLSAYIPLLEVRPACRGRGIGSELVRRLLARIGDLYMVDLVCDEDVVDFYERLGFRRHTAMMIRNRDAL